MAGIALRQNYNRLAARLAMQAGRYAHARQFKRMRKALKNLNGFTGRVLRDLRRQLEVIPNGPLRERVLDSLVLVGRLLQQESKSKGKIYALHDLRSTASRKARPASGTSSAPRSASPPPSMKASSSACGPCREIPMTATLCQRRWNRSKS